MNLNKFFLFLISLSIGIGLFLWIYKVIGWQGIKDSFLFFTSWQGMVIFCLTLLIALVGNWKWQEILKELLKEEDKKISFFELFGPYLVVFSVTFLAPVLFWTAEIFRAYFLKEKKSISWTKGIASLLIDRGLRWIVSLIVIIFGTLFFLYKIDFPSKSLLILSCGIFLFFVGGISFFYLKIFKKESITNLFLKTFNHRLKTQPLKIEKEIFDFFHAKSKAMWKIISLSFLRVLLLSTRAWLLIFFLGKEISPLAVLSILGFSLLATIIPIPAALGTHEIIQVFAFNSLGMDASLATAFTLIIRGAELILALVGIIILFRLGFSLLINKLFQKIDKLTGN